jgi:MSHA type pilus biogenesis protein MshL
MVAFQALGHAGRGTARPGCCEDARLRRISALMACVLAALLLAGCYKRSVLPQSEGHITTPAAKPALADVPPPARVSSFVPEPKPAVRPPTYSVVVNEVPVKELLFALARDTRQNIDIHPGLQGLVSLNAINETLPAILDRVAKQVNMRYRIEGNTIIVSPDTSYMKTYRVNYVNMTRDTTSTIGVSGQIQAAGVATSGGGVTAGGSGAGSQLNSSSTVVKTISNNNFWDTLRDNIRAILASTRSQSLTAEQRAERAETQRTAREERLQQAEAVARAGPAATQLFNTAFGSQPSAIPLAGDTRDDIVVNAATGTISVLATEKQHALIQQHIDSITQASQRQVLIEATIAEVLLSDLYQGGIDWSRLAVSGGINFTQSLLSTISGTTVFPGSMTIGYSNPTSSIGNIASTVKLLNQFGNTRVLSSPKMMTLNNQTALLKVVDNTVYFTIESTTVTTASVAATTNVTTTPQTVPVGVVMTLTPQINVNGQVTLTVRPTITRISGTVNDPNPSLCSDAIAKSNAGKCLVNAVPKITIREMESVLQLVSGQTAILGGLMQDLSQYNRSAVPGPGNPSNTGFLSELFSARDDQLTKSELVIFLRATVITSPSLESDDLKYFQRFLPQQTGTPAESVLGEKTGATK